MRKQKEIDPILVSPMCPKFDTNNKNFLVEIRKYETCVVFAGIFLGSFLLGVNLKGVKIPRMK